MNYINKRLKKAGTELMSIWWFFVVGIALVAILGVLIVHSSAKYDVRKTEANIMLEKSARCLTDNGVFLNENLLASNSDFESLCNFKDLNENTEYYLEINLYKTEYCEENNDKNTGCKTEGLIKSFILGNKNIKTKGLFSGASDNEGENFPLGIKRTLYAIKKSNNEKIIIHMVAVIKKVKENVNV